ncbi:MAG TPA: T9SS type A sorting domain-containing protein [Anditalea sp.]|nr:T9SS type A sorting domain-containing protein [Anditalea sp.]
MVHPKFCYWLLSSLLFFLTNISVAQLVEWQKPFRAGTDLESMKMDEQGNIYVSGFVRARSQAYIGEYQLPYSEVHYTFLIKMDSTLDIKWVKQFKGQFSDLGAVQIPVFNIDNDGNIVAAIRFKYNLLVDDLAYWVGVHDFMTVVMKFDYNGNILWSNKIEQDDLWFITKVIEVGNDNSVYLIGDAGSPYTIYDDGIPVKEMPQDQSIFFINYSDEGNFRWVKHIPGTNKGNIVLRDVVKDSYDNFYFAGAYVGQDLFDDILVETSTMDIFFGKLSSNQNIEWVKLARGLRITYSFTVANGIAIDEKLNALYITGAFSVKTDFGGQVVEPEDNNIFLARYTLEGDLVWVEKMGSFSGLASYTEEGTNLKVDNEGMIYVSGTIGQSGHIGGIRLEASIDPTIGNRYFDTFFAKFTPFGKVLWATIAGNPRRDDNLSDWLKLSNGNILIGGETGFNAIFGKHNFGAEDTEFNASGYLVFLVEKDTTILNLSQNELLFSPDSALNRSLEVISTGSWKLSSDQNWLTFNQTEGVGSQILNLQVNPNKVFEGRNAKVTFTSHEGVALDLNIFQEGLDLVTHLEDDYEFDFSVYPNPTSEFIYIRSFKSIDSINIYNMNGMVIPITSFDNGVIDARTLDNGIYILNVTIGNKSYVKKIIKR